MADSWVGLYNGVPPDVAFSSTGGKGTPIVIDVNTNTPYYAKPGAGPTAFAGGGTSSVAGTITVTVPNTNSGRFEHEETVAAVGVTASSKILLTVAPHLDTDENAEDALEILSMGATPGLNTLLVKMSFAFLTSGAIKLNFIALP
jgi:hypothetical protein